jgi:site-specific recombinase XerD
MKIQTINGQRISKSFKKKSDAEHWGATMLLEKSKVGDDKDKAADALQLSHLSMSEAISKYLGQHTGKDTSVSHRLKFWKAQIGHIAVCKVTQKHIRDAIKQLQAEGKSGSTQNRFKSAISSVFEYLREEHTTLANPARGIKSKRESRGLQAVYAYPDGRLYRREA